MSRARHHTKEHHGKHHADGGVGGSKVGNPNIFKMLDGKGAGKVHGESAHSHLGVAKGGKIKAHKRAKGGACEGNYSSAKFEKGGQSGGHKELSHKAEVRKDGVGHLAHGGKAEHHKEHHHRGRK